jgi:hypothetical protein
MFRDLVNSSPHCQHHPYKMELKKVVALARRRDAQVAAQEDLVVPKVLNLTGVVFHESRCGSTLVANALIGMNPTQHRTYSESTPPAVAIKSVCGETYQLCSVDQASWVLRDVMYLMSRSNDPLEERVFFKFQSVTTRNLPVFLKAFPDVPWIFVYRDPVQVMMSHIRDGIDRANCVRGRQRPPRIVQDIVQRRGTDLEGRPLNLQSMPGEYFCAAHLASITESALSALQDDPDEVAKHRGIPVRYDDLPEILYQEILPNHWGVTVSPEEVENILQVSGKYAKGRGNRAGDFQGDSEQKEEEASTLVKQAAELFLKPSFDALSEFEY